MKTYKTFRNVNQVINEVQGIAFDVARVSGSYLPISDSKIDAELLRKSTAEQRAAGITIYVREHGTQYANTSEVAEVRAAWGSQIVRTIEITKERGGLWVVALDCLTRYDENGEVIPQTAEQIKADAAQAQSVARMAKTEAVITGKASHIKAAELAQAEADRLTREAVRAELAEAMAHTEPQTIPEDDNEPQGGELIESGINFDNCPTCENFPLSEKVQHMAHEIARRGRVALSWCCNLFLPVLCVAGFLLCAWFHIVGAAPALVADCWRVGGSALLAGLAFVLFYFGPFVLFACAVYLTRETFKYKDCVNTMFL